MESTPESCPCKSHFRIPTSSKPPPPPKSPVKCKSTLYMQMCNVAPISFQSDLAILFNLTMLLCTYAQLTRHPWCVYLINMLFLCTFVISARLTYVLGPVNCQHVTSLKFSMKVMSGISAIFHASSLFLSCILLALYTSL